MEQEQKVCGNLDICKSSRQERFYIPSKIANFSAKIVDTLQLLQHHKTANMDLSFIIVKFRVKIRLHFI